MVHSRSCDSDKWAQGCPLPLLPFGSDEEEWVSRRLSRSLSWPCLLTICSSGCVNHNHVRGLKLHLKDRQSLKTT
eukprot:5451396-Amphidinium_carterae.1